MKKVHGWGSALAVAVALLAGTAGSAQAAKVSVPTHSTTIALTRKDRFLVAVNRETNSISVLQVRSGSSDTKKLLAEIPVGLEPRSVAIDPKGKVAYVSNALDGTVSIVSLQGPTRFSILGTIAVGTEPRGCALTPNGKKLFVANHTQGTVSVIDTARRQVVGTVSVGGNPAAIAITNDGDKSDDDETVFVTQFFSELINGKDQVDDEARQGVVRAFPVGALSPITKITLSPLANSGFTGDRTKFCFVGNANVHDQIFCPDVSALVTDTKITADPQGAFPNQLASALIRGGKVFLPNIGAGPEPPVKFNVNVQALVNVVDAKTLAENANLTVNLNAEVKAETAPANPTASLDKLFGNDIVAIDADRAGKVFLIVSRGGNFVFRASLNDQGKLTLGSPVTRFQTGNLPDGVVVSGDGARAYAYNEVGLSVTAINLQNNSVPDRDIATATPPAPGSFQHAVLTGKLAFFTALGTPDDGLRSLPIRDIIPLENRGKQSDNAWSSCASCHPDGLSDGVTWSFDTGPRQTLALDAFFAKDNPADQRISNWSGVRSSVTDFNNNSRNVQGGKGFAGDPPNPNIYNHGISQGASDALDLQTLWVQTVRTLNEPTPAAGDVNAGRTVFAASCASCHGGVKWTKSQIFYASNPAFTADPANGGLPRDAGVTATAGQIISYTSNATSITLLEQIGTFDVNNPFELRGAGAKQGEVALGALGFNVPSLLGVAFTAPYLHDGSAATLDDVFTVHQLSASTITQTLSATQRTNLKAFLNSIDSRTEPIASDGDVFRNTVAAGAD